MSVFQQWIGTRSDKILVSPLDHASESMKSFNPLFHRRQAKRNRNKEGQRAMVSYSFFHFMAKHKNNANSLFVNIMLIVNP